jgi:acetyltransferase
MMTPRMTEIHEDTAFRGGLREIVFPHSIAIVGASERNLRPVQGALAGNAEVVLVNPNRDEVAGQPCFPSIAAAGAAPELALLLVSHARVVQALEEALEAGVRAFVVPGIGAEAGPEGPGIVERVRELADRANASIVGPNCMGIACPGGPSTWIGSVPDTFLPGRVSVVAQSGSIGEAFIACGPRIGFRCVASTGGEVNRDAADLLAFLADDEGTQTIGLFLETVRRPQAFAGALDRAAQAGKPVVCLKVGRSDAAARAALAHTGAVVGSARAFSALLRRAGAIEVTDVHDLFETLEVLGRRRRPAGMRVAAVSESGGECALLADQGADAGVPFAPLPQELASALQAEFPNFTSPENPLDAWAISDVNVVYPRSFSVLAESGAYDILVAQVDLSRFRGTEEGVWCEMIVRSLADATDGTEVFPAVTSVHAADPPDAIAALARERDLPLLRGTGHGLRALAAAAAWRPCRTVVREPPIDLADLLAQGALPEHESALALERYGVEFAPRRRAANAAEAAAAAAELGFPVVVKVDGPAHKAAEGGVALGVDTPEAARAATERLGAPVLVARQLPGGIEAFCGMTRDPDYGPVLAVGLGGEAVEALSLASVCLAPVDLDLAREMVNEAPGLARVAASGTLEALARTLAALGRLAVDHPAIAECDVNPLILSADGAIAVDALIVVGGTE